MNKKMKNSILAVLIVGILIVGCNALWYRPVSTVLKSSASVSEMTSYMVSVYFDGAQTVYEITDGNTIDSISSYLETNKIRWSGQFSNAIPMNSKEYSITIDGKSGEYGLETLCAINENGDVYISNKKYLSKDNETERFFERLLPSLKSQ